MNQKLGFSFTKLDSSGRLVGYIYDWLNEAVTEELNIRIFEDHPSRNGYSIERQALRKMIEDGVPEKLIFDAYFEDYDPDHPDRVPRWKALVAKINEVYPEGLEKLKKVEEEVAEEKRKLKEKYIAQLGEDQKAER